MVSSHSRTTAGFRVFNGWLVSVDAAAGDVELGAAARDALAQCGDGAPVPDRGQLPIAPLLAALGVRSWKRYVEGTRTVSVRADGDIELMPMENCGARDGFHELPDEAFRIDEPDDATLGRAVLDGLARAR